MKRRDVIKGSVGAAGLLVPLKAAWANEPCPPVLLGGGEGPSCAPSGPLPVGAITHVAVTPHQIAMLANLTGAIAGDSVATVRYRQSGASTWRIGHPLYLNPGNFFAGCIFDLDPAHQFGIPG